LLSEAVVIGVMGLLVFTIFCFDPVISLGRSWGFFNKYWSYGIWVGGVFSRVGVLGNLKSGEYLIVCK